MWWIFYENTKAQSLLLTQQVLLACSFLTLLVITFYSHSWGQPYCARNTAKLSCLHMKCWFYVREITFATLKRCGLTIAKVSGIIIWACDTELHHDLGRHKLTVCSHVFGFGSSGCCSERLSSNVFRFSLARRGATLDHVWWIFYGSTKAQKFLLTQQARRRINKTPEGWNRPVSHLQHDKD